MKAQPRNYHRIGLEYIADQKAQETSWPVTMQEVEQRAAKVTWYPLGHEFKGFLGLILKTIAESCNSFRSTQIGVIEADNGPDGFPLEIYVFDSSYKSGDVKRALTCFIDCAGQIVPMFTDTFTD
jgi:hypothetical protein